MDKLKGGVSSFGTTLKGGASGLTHTTKGGISGISSHMKDGVEHLSDFGSSIKDTVLHRKKEYDYIDDLINNYTTDIKTSISGLKFLQQQVQLIGTKHWPNFFKINLNIVELYIKLLGQNSLSFKGIEKYYQEFSAWQNEQIIPHVHPKDRQFLIRSINDELWSYKAALEQLKDAVIPDWIVFLDSIKEKIKAMIKHLKSALKLIKLRNKKKREKEKTEGQISKLMTKTSPLDDREQLKLSTLEVKLKPIVAVFNKLEDKIKTVLPFVMTFFEEFLDNITKLIVCEQNKVYTEVFLALKYYSTFHGLLTNKEVNDRLKRKPSGFKTIDDSQANENDDEIDQIIKSWEAAITPIKYQIETNISILALKNPNRAEQELDPNVKEDLQVTKLWQKATHSLDKKNPLKPHNHVEGVFSEDVVADNLEAFEKYNNHQINQSETYNPSKMLDIDDIIVPHSVSIPGSPKLQDPQLAPPPLPPRTNVVKPVQNTLSVGAISGITSPRSSIAMGVFSPQQHQGLSSDSLTDDDDDTDPRASGRKSSATNSDIYDNDDESSILSESSGKTSLSLGSTGIQNSGDDNATKNVSKIYNKSKNDILYAPELPIHIDTSIESHADNTLFQPMTSVSYKLAKFNRFFDCLSKNLDLAKQAVAVQDFNGDEPGDLRFKKDDKISILYSFPRGSVIEGWYVGMTGETGRIGFVPGNCIEFE